MDISGVKIYFGVARYMSEWQNIFRMARYISDGKIYFGVAIPISGQ